MENQNIQREILFAIDSSFVRKELYQNNISTNNRPPATSAAEQFEEACWDGMIREWLPGVSHSPDDKKLFLWKVFVANAFVSVELSETSSDIKARQSLNPYLFFSSINNN